MHGIWLLIFLLDIFAAIRLDIFAHNLFVKMCLWVQIILVLGVVFIRFHYCFFLFGIWIDVFSVFPFPLVLWFMLNDSMVNGNDEKLSSWVAIVYLQSILMFTLADRYIWQYLILDGFIEISAWCLFSWYKAANALLTFLL